MNQQERNELGIILANTATYYNRQINQATISMMIDDFEDLSIGEILMAIKIYRKDAKNKTFPLPAQIKEILDPSVNSKTEAIEAASRIIESVSAFGYTSPKRAKEYIGEVGWEVVKRHGGWQYLCENLGVDLGISTFQAQARDAAQAIMDRSMQGRSDQPPQLPPSNTIKFLEIANSSIKDLNSIASKKNDLNDSELNDRRNLLLNQAEKIDE